MEELCRSSRQKHILRDVRYPDAITGQQGDFFISYGPFESFVPCLIAL
jgi:hypothetical protein